MIVENVKQFKYQVSKWKKKNHKTIFVKGSDDFIDDIIKGKVNIKYEKIDDNWIIVQSI